MTDKLQKKHTKARRNFDRIQSALRDEREQCLEDRRFYSIAGAMWEGKLGDQYENKPKFEINKSHLSMIKIFNEYRNNRITVKFLPKNGKKNDELSDTLNGLFRADEQDCVADEAYDNGFEEGSGGGIGAWRLKSKYEDDLDDENEKQRICMEPIFDADTSVYFDLNAKRYDKSDAKYCFVVSSYEREDYIEEFDDDPDSWPKDVNYNEFDWNAADVIYVAEYYEVEEVNEIIQIWKNLDDKETEYTDEDFENDPELEKTLNAIGTVKVRDKKVKRRKVHKYLMSGSKILEDLGYVAGSEIPIVPMYGKRWFIDNIERCMGHIRLSKDPQRLKNMQVSKLAEISALSPVEKPIFAPEQIAGHQAIWRDENINNYAYLTCNPLRDKDGNPVAQGPLDYTRVPNVPPAMGALLQLTDTDLKDILGNHQQNEEIKSNISGKAVELIQNKLDMQTFIYMSNMAKSMKRTGEIWLSMAKELYIESGREMKTLGNRDEVDSVELSRPFLNDKTGEVEYQNDLTRCNMGVSVSIGPSSDSKRASTVRALTEMITLTQGDPEAQSVLISMAMMNLEGEGIDDTRDFFRQRLVDIGAVKPTQEELEQMQAEQQNRQPDANQIYLESAAQNEQAKAQKAQADTMKVFADIEKTQADTEKTQAQTIEVISNVSEQERTAAVGAIETLGNAEQTNREVTREGIE